MTPCDKCYLIQCLVCGVFSRAHDPFRCRVKGCDTVRELTTLERAYVVHPVDMMYCPRPTCNRRKLRGGPRDKRRNLGLKS